MKGWDKNMGMVKHSGWPHFNVPLLIALIVMHALKTYCSNNVTLKVTCFSLPNALQLSKYLYMKVENK